MNVLVSVLFVVAVVSCTPLATKEDSASGFIDEVSSCVDTEDAVSCIKEQALDKVQRFEAARSLQLFSGVTLLNSNPRKSRSYEPLSTDTDVRKKQVSERLWKSSAELMKSGEIELTFGDDEGESESRAINEDAESRGKKNKKKISKKKLKTLIPLALLAHAKGFALIVLALLVIASSLFKLTFMAKIAFIFKIIAIIKALLAKKHQHETWEVAPPHGWEPYAEHNAQYANGWDGHQGWSRSIDEGSQLAYSAYED